MRKERRLALLYSAALAGVLTLGMRARAAPLELQRPSARLENRFSYFPSLLSGFPLVTEFLQGEFTLGLSDETSWALKMTPLGRIKAPNALGGVGTPWTAEGDLREAWIEFAQPSWELRLGNQILSWGAADRINPTDNWNSIDYYDLFLTDKVSEFTARLRLHPSLGPSAPGLELEALLTPFFRESRFPVAFPATGTRTLSLTTSRWMLPLPNFVLVGGIPAPIYYELASPSYPVTWQGALRLKAMGIGGWDFSCSYFDGIEKDPRVAFTAQGTAGNPVLPLTLTLNPSYHRTKILGLDGAGGLSIAGKDFGIRFEGALGIPDNSRVALLSSAQQAELVRDRYVHFVGGVDHTLEQKLWGTVLYWNLMGVYFERIDRSEVATGSTTSVSGMPNFYSWDRNLVLYVEDRIDSRWTASLSTVWSIRNGDFLLTPEIRWAISDTLKASLGGHFFLGSRQGFFGQLYDAQRILLRTEWLF